MQFHYKSLRIIDEGYVGSGRGYVIQQTRYDLGSAQDHTVDVSLASVFLEPSLFGMAGCFGLVLTIPLGFLALFVLFDRFPPLAEGARTVGAIFLVCGLIVYLIAGVSEIRGAAERAVRKQRNPADGSKLHFVPAEQWDTFAAALGENTASRKAQASRFDAVERHSRTPKAPRQSSEPGI